jgi:putative nucleotidyltransferase with HDIG domain
VRQKNQSGRGFFFKGGVKLKYLKRLLGGTKKRLSAEERILIDKYLDDAGQFLFFQMDKIDQYHALAVAKTVLEEAGYQRGINLDILVKAALLHDIGKVEGDFSIWGRIAAGLIRRLNPNWRDKFSRTSRNSFLEKICYCFYVDRIHPVRGSYMARTMGIDAKVVQLIRHHHDPPVQDQAVELTWLQTVDGKN